MILLLLLALSSPSVLQEQQSTPPRLVVLISVDQLREDQLDRLAPALSGGLQRFIQAGQRFRGARLAYSATETGPGHVTLGSGCLPDVSGVTANAWRTRGQEGTTYCVAGPAELVGVDGVFKGAGRDATNMLRPALGELIARRWSASKVISISAKDRGAIGLGGRTADTCLWWDKGGRGWVSSLAFAEALPSWAAAASRGWIYQAAGWNWQATFDTETPPPGTMGDERAGEIPLQGGAATLPLSIFQPKDLSVTKDRAKLAGLVYGVPLMDDLTLQLSLAALQEEDLGIDMAPDLLCISLSNCDTIGHRFGPKSVEVTDTLLRVDRGLGVLFDILDRRLGADGWIACLSADHGIVDLPEQRVADGLFGLRVEKAELNRLRVMLRSRLKETYGSSCNLSVANHQIWLNAETLLEAGADPDKVRGELAQWVRELVPWAESVFTHEELTGEGAPGILGLAQVCFGEERAPDVWIHAKAGTVLGMERGTTHGSAHDYDRSVPLIFLGRPFAAGEQTRAAGPEDAVPTLLKALGWTQEQLGQLDLSGESLLP